ncbi:hypothetical protein A2U01_0073844, partial [Trifolium medium]|nr:hypothetical protein [Trifolium medium]
GIIITRDDIVQVSPVKRRQNSGDFEDDQPVSEDKDTGGTEGASDAQIVKEKEKRKRTAVFESERVIKKPRTQKKKEQKVVRKLMIHEEDDEETDEEPL